MKSVRDAATVGKLEFISALHQAFDDSVSKSIDASSIHLHSALHTNAHTGMAAHTKYTPTH